MVLGVATARRRIKAARLVLTFAKYEVREEWKACPA